MNANEVNEIINNICEKIGIGVSNAKEFIPALAKYKIIHNTLWGITWMLLFIVIVMIFKAVYRNYMEGKKVMIISMESHMCLE